jgi:tRNA A-37 threonylcarbamoyl transferase component Bud32
MLRTRTSLGYNPAMDDANLASLGKYELRGTLGRGAMGTVYEGWDPAIARKVAVKTVRIPDASDTEAQDELARFRREAQAAGRLNHPNIVGVFDYGETAELAYIVMEFVDGRSLKAVLDKQERFALHDMMRVMQDVLGGLQYSHEHGVVHRDIKPANIILASGGQAKIADFGIARIESSSMTQAGTVLGTPAYMSPEQFMGQVVTARSDLYSTGVVLYQMLTGERPFEGSLTSIMHKVLNTRPPKPSDLSVTVPPGMDAVVERAMARRPEDRFASAAEFAQALREVAEAPPQSLPAVMAEEPAADATIVAAPQRHAAPAEAVASATPRARASRLPVAVAALIAALAVLGGGAWFALSPSRPSAPDVASLPAKAPQDAAPSTAPQSPAPETTAATPAPSSAATAPVPLPQAVATATPPQPTLPAAATPAPASPVQAAAAPPEAPPAPQNLPPSPAPAPAPQQLAAASSPATLRAAIAAATAQVRCTLVSGEVTEPGGTVMLGGLAGQGTPQARLHEAVADAAPGAAVDWRVSGFDNPAFCQALDAIEPVAASRFGAPSDFSAGLDGGHTHLRDGDPIIIRAAMPPFEAQLQVDYLQNDGTVAHMQPTAAYPARTYAPGARASVGEPVPGFTPPTVGEPYGTDMVLVIASARPLFAQQRPETEPIAAYLKDLSAALAAAQGRHERVVAGAFVVHTAPRH